MRPLAGAGRQLSHDFLPLPPHGVLKLRLQANSEESAPRGQLFIRPCSPRRVFRLSCRSDRAPLFEQTTV